MSDCEDTNVIDGPGRRLIPRRIKQMKKFMSLMLGMTLVLGAVTVVSAQDKKEDKKEDGKKKGKKKEVR